MPRRRHPNWPLRALALVMLATLLGYIVLFPAAIHQFASDDSRGTPVWMEAPSLGEVMGTREATTQRQRTKSAELALCIPPLAEIHLPHPSHNQAKPKQAVQLERCACLAHSLESQ